MNGVESWIILRERCRLPTRQRAVGRLSQILTSRFATESMENSFTQWEDGIHIYGAGNTQRAVDDMKIAVLVNSASGNIQEHLQLNAGAIDSYHHARCVSLNYIRS